VTVTEDKNGVEARRFGSETSSQAALYCAAGQRSFKREGGGIL